MLKIIIIQWNKWTTFNAVNTSNVVVKIYGTFICYGIKTTHKISVTPKGE